MITSFLVSFPYKWPPSVCESVSRAKGSGEHILFDMDVKFKRTIEVRDLSDSHLVNGMTVTGFDYLVSRDRYQRTRDISSFAQLLTLHPVTRQCFWSWSHRVLIQAVSYAPMTLLDRHLSCHLLRLKMQPAKNFIQQVLQ